jgi:hypothetical protein
MKVSQYSRCQNDWSAELLFDRVLSPAQTGRSGDRRSCLSIASALATTNFFHIATIFHNGVCQTWMSTWM